MKKIIAIILTDPKIANLYQYTSEWKNAAQFNLAGSLVGYTFFNFQSEWIMSEHFLLKPLVSWQETKVFLLFPVWNAFKMLYKGSFCWKVRKASEFICVWTGVQSSGLNLMMDLTSKMPTIFPEDFSWMGTREWPAFRI